MEDGAAPKTWTVPLTGQRARAREEIIIPGARDRADTTELARRFKLNDAHVRRLLRFSYLAPDIVEAIVEGRQPRSLTVKRRAFQASAEASSKTGAWLAVHPFSADSREESGFEANFDLHQFGDRAFGAGVFIEVLDNCCAIQRLAPHQ